MCISCANPVLPTCSIEPGGGLSTDAFFELLELRRVASPPPPESPSSKSTIVTAMMGATISLILASMYGLSGDGEFPDATTALLLNMSGRSRYYGYDGRDMVGNNGISQPYTN